VAVPLIAVAAALGVKHFRSEASTAAQARLVLEGIRSSAFKQNGLEWQSIAEGKVGPNSLDAIEEDSASMHRGFRLLIEAGWGTYVHEVDHLLDIHTQAVREEFTLLAAGREEAASKIDEERVDPAFTSLHKRLDTLAAVISKHSAEADRRAQAASIAILLGATVAILSLLLLFHRSRQRALGSTLARAALEQQVEATSRIARDREYEANHDSLTGLANRRCFLRRVHDEVLRAATSGERMAVLLIDLDHFKEINDTLGHKAGDSLLEQLGPRMLAAVRERDLVVRLGGDEFALLIAAGGGDTGAEAEALAERLRDAISEPFTIDGVELHVQGSIGIALFPDDAPDADSLLRLADIAMYQAKHTPRGHALYAAEDDLNSRERLALAGELRGAIAQGELVLHYQPKAEIASGHVSSVEALVRWQHPVHGLLAPDRFIPLAERAGVMRELTHYVLDAALAQRAAWSEQGIELDVAVNIAAANVIDRQLPGTVAKLLASHGVEPHALQLELTENTLMTDPQSASEVIGQLAELGVALSLDDFGTGYSSLAQLKGLRVEEIKIDRSLVNDMAVKGDSAAIVRSTIELARTLGLRVVAEGVETAAALLELEQYGCDVAQGFYISRAVPAAELTEWLADENRSARAAVLLGSGDADRS
jgi:diguanylate cyclase (GGDEF)-like protein